MTRKQPPAGLKPANAKQAAAKQAANQDTHQNEPVKFDTLKNDTAELQYVLVGGGGHAAVVLEAIRASGMIDPVGVLDADPARRGTGFFGVPIVGGDDTWPELVRCGIRRFVSAIGSTADTAVRRRVFERMVVQGGVGLTIRHPTAIVSPSASLGAGCQVSAGAIVNTAARIGRNVIVNTGAIVEHDCRIGDHVHLATGCRLAGGVTIGEGTHVGIGATVIQGIKIGRDCVIAAGAVVIRDVADRAVVGGVPAVELEGRLHASRRRPALPRNVSFTLRA
jgi:sugar O-acyltransferase (sialic acid O-acetyltransferase NeuD family)